MEQELPSEITKLIEEAQERFGKSLTELLRWSYQDGEDAPTAVEIENKIREWITRIGEDTQSLVLGHMDRHVRKSRTACPKCGKLVSWKRYARRRYVTSLGELWLERAYYHHGDCHCGWIPLDKRLGLGASELSPFVQEIASHLGSCVPFQHAAKFLERYMGIEVSHDTVNETTVRIGQALGEEQEAEVERAWREHEPPESEADTAPDDLYMTADGITFLLPSGQGKEIRVAGVFETEERKTRKGELEIHARDIDYFVEYDVESLARTAYVGAAKRGLHDATRRVVVGDGAHWIWKRIAPMMSFPDCEQILDFYHATKYLTQAADSVLGEGSDRSKQWAQQACHTLKHEGAKVTLKLIRALPVPKNKPPKAITDAITYFENNIERMDYPRYRHDGLQIGSGSVESGVLQVVGDRLNRAGMRWNPDHAEAVAQVRAAIRSDRWDRFWAAYRPTPRMYRRHAVPN